MQAKLILCGTHMTCVSDEEAELLYATQQQGHIVDVIEECYNHPNTYVVGIGPNRIIILPEKYLEFVPRTFVNPPNYLEQQLFKVAPLPILEGNNGQVRLKLISPQGKTNWLNITPKQHAELEKILLSALDQ